MNVSRVLGRRLSAVVCSALFTAALTPVLRADAPMTGAVFTTDVSGTVVNQNLYDDRAAVYLNGGPQNSNASGLPDGTYYFQVTDPSGATLLSSDPASARQLIVVNGQVAGAAAVPGAHTNGTFNPANGTTGVQLWPFDATPNEGGEYKAWLIAQTSTTTVDDADPRVLHFATSDTKTDNFKVNGAPLAITAPADWVQCNDKGRDGAYVQLPQPKTSGGVGAITVSFSPASGSFFPIGSTAVTATATDAAGNSVNCTFLVTVNDCEGPRLAGGSTFALQATLAVGSCTATVTYDASLFTDFSGVAGVTFTPQSGTGFATGTNAVGYVATDKLGNISSGTFLVNVTDKIPPTIAPLSDLVVSTDPGKCSAVVTFAPTASDCNGVTVTAFPASGSVFPKGTTVVTVTAVDSFGNGATASFNVTVNDKEPPVVTAPASISDALRTVHGSVENVGTATATDNCDVPVISGTRSDGRALTDFYPLGTTTITWTAVDSAGNTGTASQTVTIVGGTVKAGVFYDANTNGTLDTGEAPLPGWAVTLVGTDSAGNVVTAQTIATDANGASTFAYLPLGTYTLTEAKPVTTGWYATSATSVSVVLDQVTTPVSATFGDIAIGAGAGGGLTIGFWGNKNGQATMGGTTTAIATNLANLSRLSLRNAAGTAMTFTTYSAFNSWLQSATATNMAYMLSAQLAAMYNNVNVRPNAFGGVHASALCYAPGATAANSAGFASVGALINEAVASLTVNSVTVATGATRSYQEALKTALDNGNNNRNFVQPKPPAYTF